jgi:hypothetical protein
MNRFATVAAGFLAFTGLSLASAWLNIQAVRYGYRNQRLRSAWEDMRKSEQVLDRRLQQTLSLDRLDKIAREQFKLKVPAPDQVVLIREDRDGKG